MRMLSTSPNVWIVWIGNGEVARFRTNHSVVVSSLVVALGPGDLAILVLYSAELSFFLKNGSPHEDKFSASDFSLPFLLCLTSM